MKLFTRYVRINIVLIVCVLLASCLILKLLIYKVLVHELDEEFEDIELAITQYIEATNTVPESSVLYSYKFERTAVNAPGEAHNKSIERYVPAKHGYRKFRQRVFYVSDQGQWYRLSIEKQVEGTRIMTRTLISLSLGTMLVVIGLLFFINKLVLMRLWTPFYQTLGMMRGFKLNTENDLEFPVSNVEEFNYMNSILKTATQKAGQDYVALKEFTENASHELQTPLSIMGSKLDILIQDEQLSERQHMTIISAYTALKRMSQLNQSLLLLAKIGNQQFSNTATIPMHQKLHEKIELFQELWQDQNLSVKAEIGEAYISMNPDLNEILINNLLSNATRHSVPGGVISIELTQGSFSISNTGSKQPLDPQKLFKRFYKSDQSSNTNGLGLSIIKQICDVSGISIDYGHSKTTHRFTLKWPS